MHTRKQKQRNTAFSLVELSIVLVILGLLVGGILAGKSLIRASELRSIGTQYNTYVTAVQGFRDKYFALPGDMINATSFWGVADATNCRITEGVGTATCNGNNDRLISYTCCINTNGDELYRFWQHLANAGLIEGSFTGIGGSGNINYHSVPGSNVPAARMADVGWTMYNRSYTGHSWIPDQTAANRFWVGAQAATAWNYGIFLTPEDLWNLDTKLDDGMPMLGNVRAIRYNTCTNAVDGADTAATYLLTSTAIACALTFENRGHF